MGSAYLSGMASLPRRYLMTLSKRPLPSVVTVSKAERPLRFGEAAKWYASTVSRSVKDELKVLEPSCESGMKVTYAWHRKCRGVERGRWIRRWSGRIFGVSTWSGYGDWLDDDWCIVYIGAEGGVPDDVFPFSKKFPCVSDGNRGRGERRRWRCWTGDACKIGWRRRRRRRQVS